MHLRSRSVSGTKLLVFGTALTIAVLAGWWIAGHISAANTMGAAAQAGVNPPPVKSVAHLYFGDDQGRHLVAEQRVVEKPADRASFGRLLIEALIKGPTQGAARTLPGDAQLDAVYVTPAGVTYIDFAENSFSNHPGGIGAELLSIYSIVNTLVLNVDGIRSVKILIGGREAATLAGHADLQAPFEVDMLWVR